MLDNGLDSTRPNVSALLKLIAEMQNVKVWDKNTFLFSLHFLNALKFCFVIWLIRIKL